MTSSHTSTSARSREAWEGVGSKGPMTTSLLKSGAARYHSPSLPVTVPRTPIGSTRPREAILSRYSLRKRGTSIPMPPSSRKRPRSAWKSRSVAARV